MATRVISLANQKGGVAKTTTAVNLAFGLARAGKVTLLVDIDPNANATEAVIGYEEPERTIYDLLRDEKLKDVITKTGELGLDFIPSEEDLAGAYIELSSPTILRTKFRSRVLKKYDYVIIDTPPSLGFLTANALVASTEVIIPVSASFFALRGLVKLEKTIERAKELAPNLRISGVVCTLYDYTNLAKDVYSAIEERFGDRTFKTRIPKNVKVDEAQSRSRSIFDYAPKSKGAQAYEQFVKEVLSHD